MWLYFYFEGLNYKYGEVVEDMYIYIYGVIILIQETRKKKKKKRGRGSAKVAEHGVWRKSQ